MSRFKKYVCCFFGGAMLLISSIMLDFGKSQLVDMFQTIVVYNLDESAVGASLLLGIWFVVALVASSQGRLFFKIVTQK